MRLMVGYDFLINMINDRKPVVLQSPILSLEVLLLVVPKDLSIHVSSIQLWLSTGKNNDLM